MNYEYEVLLADCESDNLLDKMTLIHCIQIGTEDGDEVDVYADHPGYKTLAEGLERLKNAPKVVWHGGINFDHWAVNKISPGTLRKEQMVDTVVIGRLAFPEERSHQLKTWGIKLGEHKGDYKGDFQTFDEELVTYAIQDIRVLRKLWKLLKAATATWGQSVDLEHEVAWAINSQERNGFHFNVPLAQELYAELRGDATTMEAELAAIFPPIERTSIFIPKRPNKTKGYIKGEPVYRKTLEPFNPASRAHIAERLQLAGWVPKEFGKDGTPTCDEKTLGSLSPTKYAGLETILKYFSITKKIGMLSDGKVGWLKMVNDKGVIHGRVNPNGACTGRMSHSKPNVAQADKKDKRMRQLWGPRKGWVLMGCDAEGLEARQLGHYLWRYDNGSFSDRTVNGSKDDGTDVHSMNMKALNRIGIMVDREGAKTILYALMYGAGDFKLSNTARERIREIGGTPLRVPHKEAGLMIRKALQGAMQGLGKLTEAILAKQASAGYIVGLDGRHITLRSKHSALNTLLQGAGAIVMKLALALFMRLHGHRDQIDFGLCANVHDEVQVECRTTSIAHELGLSFADCIREAGVQLGVKCPLAGKHEVGSNWSETH